MLVWVLFLLVAVTFLRHEPDPQTAQRISQAFKDLQMLHQQSIEINQLLSDYSISDSAFRQVFKDMVVRNSDKNFQGVKLPFGKKLEGESSNIGEWRQESALDYEKMRRRLNMGVEEMWYFISSQIKLAKKQAGDASPQMVKSLDKILDEGLEHKRWLVKDLGRLAEVDGHARWREREAEELSRLVQKRIHQLQNPKDCSKARKLLCSLNKGCGYGCQLHHIVYCMLVAYGTERTMVLKSKGWRYHRAGWEDVYQPVSNTCVDPSGASVSYWPGTASTQVVQLPIIDSVAPRPPHLPQAVPADLAARISRLHGHPFVWWVGQFFKFLLRPQPATAAMLNDTAANMNYKTPIVGVHIRRTDKIGTEAAFHSVDEYMSKVADYYDQLAMTQAVPVRRVYLASDDPKVFAEMRAKYAEYEVIGDPNVAKMAAVATRYSDSSLNGIIMDIHFLSRSDYLVCTFSSQVCRVAYEIMQSLHADASDRFASLDDIYYFGGQNAHRQLALAAHRARTPDQMAVEAGDSVAAFGNHWDGYSMGRNMRTNQVGLYPTFKVQDLIETVDFPKYSESDKPSSNENHT